MTGKRAADLRGNRALGKKDDLACPCGQAMSRPNKLDHSDTLQQKYA